MSSAGRKVLWIDDETHHLEYYRMLFDDIGVVVDFEAEVGRAVERLDREPYALVLLDLLLPAAIGSRAGSDPFGPCLKLLDEHARRGGAWPPVVVVTGLTDPTVLQEVRTRGVERIIYKPIDFDSLQAIVERHVQGARPDADW